MNNITGIASTLAAISQSQTQNQSTMSILKVNAQADAAMADMLRQNARQIQANSIRETAALSIFLPEGPSSFPRDIFELQHI